MAPVVIYPVRGEPLFRLIIALGIIATAVIVLRFWSRYTLRAKQFGADDWLALAAWPFVLTLFVASGVRLRYGMGTHMLTVPPENLRLILILEWAGGYHAWQFSMALIRTSALCFYGRVFELRHKYIKYNFWASMVCNILWLAVAEFVIIFECTPLRAAWIRTIPHTCLDIFKTIIGIGVASIMLDIWVLILPMPLIWALDLPRKRKVILGLVFACGYCVVILAIGRLIAVTVIGNSINVDFTWNFVNVEYWYGFETELGFVCISLPSLFHLWNRVRRHGLKSMLNNYDYSESSHTSETTLTTHARHASIRQPVNSIRKQVSIEVESSSISQQNRIYVPPAFATSSQVPRTPAELA